LDLASVGVLFCAAVETTRLRDVAAIGAGAIRGGVCTAAGRVEGREAFVDAWDKSRSRTDPCPVRDNDVLGRTGALFELGESEAALRRGISASVGGGMGCVVQGFSASEISLGV